MYRGKREGGLTLSGAELRSFVFGIQEVLSCIRRTHLEQGSDFVPFQIRLNPGLLRGRHGETAAARRSSQRDEIMR